jgi:hypothetical protein
MKNIKSLISMACQSLHMTIDLATSKEHSGWFSAMVFITAKSL